MNETSNILTFRQRLTIHCQKFCAMQRGTCSPGPSSRNCRRFWRRRLN